MILQEINLYQDRFKEKKIILSALHLLLITGLVTLILLYSSYWYHQQFDLAESQNKTFLENKEQSTRLLEIQQKKLQALLGDNQIENKIVKISEDISVRKRVISFVGNNQFGSGEGFSSHLSGLSEINVKNIWLNEISLAEDYIKLSGSALDAEKVPEYFNEFRQQKLFSGSVFDVFELDRKKEQDWKIDFVIASRVVADE